MSGATDDDESPSLTVLPIVGRQWRSLSVGEYATRLAAQTAPPVLPLSEREQRMIAFLVDSWLEEWWKQNSQD